ncbi:MAG: hypothetical protein PHQ04_02260 [Opitutaceae bacterium]|nr:hypothetical protein [Opitutaceae bacterium]
MKAIHIGHHFFGAGNLGDDFMLAGFLAAMRPWKDQMRLTCCVPHALEPLRRRFPEIDWLPYDEPTRRSCIEQCDVWLGLGGSPFQCAVSRWFIDHLIAEAHQCARAHKPMFFLGVGGQDSAAYALPEVRAVCAQAEIVWPRDADTAEKLSRALPGGRIRLGADLAHLFFAQHSPPVAAAGRLTAVLNFDYADWPGLPAALAALERLPATERVWLAQESRRLPGAEQELFDQLPPSAQGRWRLQVADSRAATPEESLARWPSGEWLLSARYHATLAGAWAGSRAVVIATNEKLRGAAIDCGYLTLEPSARETALAEKLQRSNPPPRTQLAQFASKARQACVDFAATIGLSAP